MIKSRIHFVKGRGQNKLFKDLSFSILRSKKWSVFLLEETDEGMNSAFLYLGENKIKAEGYEITHQHIELSSSNNNVVQEMLKMIDVLRIYESYQKVIQSLDEMDSRATRDVGTVA